MYKKSLPPSDYVLSRLSYDPETGIFVFKRKRVLEYRDTGWNTRYAGCVAGSKSHGYVDIELDNESYKGHRVAWLIMTGSSPTKGIDHINGDRADNRWVNLRLADQMRNLQNIGSHSNNTSGIKGVCWDTTRQKWLAKIRVEGHNIYIGRFDNKEEAAEAYRETAINYQGEFIHPSVLIA